MHPVTIAFQNAFTKITKEDTASKQVLDNRRRVREWNIRNPDYKNHPNNRFAKFKSQAKTRGIEMTLTFEEWAGLVLGADCHYCETTITTLGCSLDRVDSDLGYTYENVVPCCGECNRIKSDTLSYAEMRFLMPLLTEFRRQRGN